MNVSLGHRVAKVPPGKAHIREEEVAEFYFEFLRANPDVLADVKDRLTHSTGAPRQLSIEAFMALGAAASINGRCHMTEIAGLAETGAAT